MNYKKMIAAVTALTIAGGVIAGCDNGKAAETTGEETEVTSEETTTDRTAEEASEAATEATTETTETTGETTEDTTEASAGAQQLSEYEILYTAFRAKAEELHEESGNDDLAFSITYIYGGDHRKYLLLVSDPQQGICIYAEEDGEVVDYDIESPFEGDEDYRNRMLSYEQFMDLPFFMVLADLSFGHYEEIPADGDYAGYLYGFSDDLSYAYAYAGTAPSFAMTPGQCMALTEDDTFTVNGDTYEIGYINDADEYGYRQIVSDDIDNGGYILYVYYGEDNVPYGVAVCDQFGEICYIDPAFRKIPVAEDCTVEVFGSSLQESQTMDLEEFRQILCESDEVTVYEDGGFGTGMCFIGIFRGDDRLPRYVTIENGQITYLSIRVDR